MKHELKTEPLFFEASKLGLILFEIRKNDRNFEVGDTVFLREWDASFPGYTGRQLTVEITYITSYAQKDGDVVFGFRKITQIKGAEQ